MEKLFNITYYKYNIRRVDLFLEKFPNELESFLKREMSRFNRKKYKIEVFVYSQIISKKSLLFSIQINIDSKRYHLTGNGELEGYVRFFYFNNTEVFNQIENDFLLLKDSITSIYHSFEQICALALFCKKLLFK